MSSHKNIRGRSTKAMARPAGKAGGQKHPFDCDVAPNGPDGIEALPQRGQLENVFEGPLADPLDETYARNVGNVPFRPPHPYRLPEDFPWKRACLSTATPVVLLSRLSALDAIAGADDLPEGSPAPCALLEPALGLARFYRSLNMEPILIVLDGQPSLGAAGKGAGKANGRPDGDKLELCQALLRAGHRAVLVEEQDVWKTIASLTSDPVFLHPVHFPLARRLTLLRLLEVGCAGIKPASCMPVFCGKGGFPLLLSPEQLEELCQGASLTDLMNQGKLQPMDTGDRDCTTFGACRVRSKADLRASLSACEAIDLLRQLRIPMKGIAHARAVGLVAMALAKRCRLKSHDVDWELALSGGLLHDIAKGISHHEAVGASWLDYLGLPRMAGCVRDHRDLVLEDKKPVTERELVYLADKYCCGPRFVPLEVRFGQKMDLYRGNEKALAGIRKRLSHARDLERRVERELGISPSHIARMVLGDGRSKTQGPCCPKEGKRP